jgi:phage host-nuclease inhibitor protein Gam
MKPTALPTDSAAAYKDLVDAQAIHTEATNRMAKLEAELQDDYLDAIDGRRKEYTDLQDALAKSEQTIKDIATMHPEWFAEVKTVTTPYGSVQSRSGTKLEVANEEVTIALLQQLGPDAAPFLRTSVELNLEALESLPDEELARVRIKRVTGESLIVKPAKPNLGKAAKAAAKKAAQKKPETV